MSSRIGRAIFVAAVMPAAIGHGGTVGSGLTYTFTITHHGLNADGKAADYEVVATEQLLGDKVWIQYFEPPQGAGSGPPDDADRRAPAPKHYGYGAYYLFDRGSTVMTVVSPDKKQYFQLDQASALQGFNKEIKVSFTNASVSISRVQPDTTIDEVPTQHWRLTDNHTEKISVLGIPASTDIRSTTDYYFIPDLRNDFNPFLRTDDYVTLAGPGDYATKMRGALDQMGAGTPVLSVEHRTTGKGVASTMVKRITGIDHPDVAVALFVVPADFKKKVNGAEMAEESAWLPDSLTTPLPEKKPGILSKAGGLFGKSIHIP
jgi:hypothetical protein